MIETWFETNPITTLILIGILAIVAGAVMYVFARLLIKSLNDSAKYEQPVTTLMLILGTISVVALIGALFTRDESAFTIAATGVGAFAGALTARSQTVEGLVPTEPGPGPIEPVARFEPDPGDDEDRP